MTGEPLTDEQLAEIEARAPSVEESCAICEDVIESTPASVCESCYGTEDADPVAMRRLHEERRALWRTDIDTLTREVRRLRGEREAERASVVAYLRTVPRVAARPGTSAGTLISITSSQDIARLADAIARGDHERAPGGDGADVERDYWVTVCSACLTASCWHGEVYCDYAKFASTVEKRASELRKLGHEHADHFSRETLFKHSGSVRDVDAEPHAQRSGEREP